MLVDEMTSEIFNLEPDRNVVSIKKALTMAASRLYRDGKLTANKTGKRKRYKYSLKS